MTDLKTEYYRVDEKGNRWYKVPWNVRFSVFWKKAVLIKKEIPSFFESDQGFNYNKITHFSEFNGEIVTHVFAKGNDFIIHNRLGTNLIVSAIPDLEKNLDNIAPAFGTMSVSLSRKEQRRFGSRISNALRLALFGAKDEPTQIIEDVNKKALLMRGNMFRLMYLLGSTTVVFLLMLLFSFYQVYDWSFGTKWDEPKLLNILIFSSIGGIFSVLLGYKTIKVEIREARWVSYFINGVSRIFISLLAGIVAYEFMMAEFIFANLNDNLYAVYCLCILAGFTETFIPGVLKKTTEELKETPN